MAGPHPVAGGGWGPSRVGKTARSVPDRLAATRRLADRRPLGVRPARVSRPLSPAAANPCEPGFSRLGPSPTGAAALQPPPSRGPPPSWDAIAPLIAARSVRRGTHHRGGRRNAPGRRHSGPLAKGGIGPTGYLRRSVVFPLSTNSPVRYSECQECLNFPVLSRGAMYYECISTTRQTNTATHTQTQQRTQARQTHTRTMTKKRH